MTQNIARAVFWAGPTDDWNVAKNGNDEMDIWFDPTTTCQKWCWIGFLWMFVNVSHYIVLWAVIVTHPIHLVWQLWSKDNNEATCWSISFSSIKITKSKNQKNKMDREEDRWERFVWTVWSHAILKILRFLVKVDPWRNFWRNLFLRVFLPPVILVEDSASKAFWNTRTKYLTFLQLPNDFEALESEHPPDF